MNRRTNNTLISCQLVFDY